MTTKRTRMSRRSSENPTRNSPFFRAPAIEVSLVPRPPTTPLQPAGGWREHPAADSLNDIAQSLIAAKLHPFKSPAQ